MLEEVGNERRQGWVRSTVKHFLRSPNSPLSINIKQKFPQHLTPG
ncbi:unnamed protein product [Tenebrio molitor]|nr:unnamed protein product [Tenebrio molitor]